jgi:asparagine synthase (glutamine-hydrolysing)
MSSPIENNFLNLQKIHGLPGWVAHWNESEGFQLLYTDDSSLPALAGNTECAVVFDGFLQNRSELLAEIGLERSPLRNEAEVVLFAYSKWEEDIVHKLRGVFLLAIWDKKRKVLLYVRDHCGIYPAFYANTGSEFIFSTSTEDIVRHPKVTRSLNRSAFVDFLCHRRPCPEETFYSDVNRVLAGHAIRVSKGKQQGFRYWYSFPPDGRQEYITDPEAAGFDEALEKAVSRCMQIGKPGIFLSGGLDSVSIASVAAVLAMKNGTPLPRGFSLGFPHPDCNEVDRQKGVAQGLGLELYMAQVNDIIAGRGLLTMGLELGRTWSQPMWNTWQPLYLVLGSKAREMGCEVVMTGGGGDEWLTVSDTLTADLIRHLDSGGLKRLIPILLRSYRLPKTAFLWHILWKSGLRLVLADYARRLARQVAPGTLRNLIRKRLRGSTVHWVAADPELQAMANDRVEILVEEYMSRMNPRGKYPFYSNSFSNHFINTITSMEMEQNFEAAERMGLTLAYPYFDPDLIQLLLRMSPEVLQQGGMEKGIVRSAVARRFPDLEFEKQKKVSAMSFWQSIITTEGRDLFYQTGGPATLIQMGIVNGNVIGAVMDDAFASKSPFQNTKIWDLLLLETWLRSRLK